jgi:hypothetical protein
MTCHLCNAAPNWSLVATLNKKAGRASDHLVYVSVVTTQKFPYTTN